MVGAVGEMVFMKRRKLWKTGEDGLCCSSRAIQTWLGPSSLLEKWSEITIVFVVSFVLSATPQTGGRVWMHPLQWRLKYLWFPVVDDTSLPIPLSPDCIEAVRLVASGVPFQVPLLLFFCSSMCQYSAGAPIFFIWQPVGCGLCSNSHSSLFVLVCDVQSSDPHTQLMTDILFQLFFLH